MGLLISGRILTNVLVNNELARLQEFYSSFKSATVKYPYLRGDFPVVSGISIFDSTTEPIEDNVIGIFPFIYYYPYLCFLSKDNNKNKIVEVILYTRYQFVTDL